MLTADIYARQSKDRLQGIKAQVADCKALCRLRGWQPGEVIADNDVSASSGKMRPGYARLLGRIERRETDLVVVTHIDRLLRKLAELEHLIEMCEKADVKIATVSGDLDLSTDAGRMVGRILAVVARGEVERKSTRQKRANKQAAEMGRARRGSPRPFGWLPDRITPDPAEAAAIRDACSAIAAGGTATGAARDWEQRGLRPLQAPFGPLREHPWARNSVKMILLNPRIAGIAMYRGAEVGYGEWVPLVREDTWRAVAETLSAPQWRRSTQGVTTMLGGIGCCRCGNYITGSTSAGGLPAYRCNPDTRNGRPGPHVHVKREAVDEAVSAAVTDFLSSPEAAQLLIPQEDGGDTAALHDEAANLRARLARLGELYADGKIGEADLVGGRERGEARLGEIETELITRGRGSVFAPLLAADPAAVWESLTLDRRRAVIDMLMTVTLHPSGRGARRFDPDVTLPPGKGIAWKMGAED